jgi:hypothetical protein
MMKPIFTERSLWRMAALFFLLAAALMSGCAGAPRAGGAVTEATRDAAHRELIQEVRIGQVLGYGWRYER